MSKAARIRSRLNVIDVGTYLSELKEVWPSVQHKRDHMVKRMVWNSKRSLDTTASSALPFQHAFKLVSILARCKTAPTGTLTVEVRVDGNAIGSVSIATGETISPREYIGVHVPEGAALTVAITSIGGAGGPVGLSFQYMDEGE